MFCPSRCQMAPKTGQMVFQLLELYALLLNFGIFLKIENGYKDNTHNIAVSLEVTLFTLKGRQCLIQIIARERDSTAMESDKYIINHGC